MSLFEDQKTASPITLDVLYGAEEIAAFINRDVRQTFYMLETGLLPAKKIGKQWTTTRTLLRQHFEEGVTVATPKAPPQATPSKRAKQHAHAKKMRDAKQQRRAHAQAKR